MINFLKYIYQQLELFNRGVYPDKAPQKDPITELPPQFPYIVYKTPSSTEIDFRDDIILEVDIWDNSPNTTAIENLTTDIDSLFQRKKYIDENMQISFYRINRLSIPDPDETIRRRQLRYLCKTYFV